MGIFYKGVFAQNGSGPSPVTGDFVPQLKTLPTADEAHLGWIVQYAGETTEDYTNGYFYRCDASHTLPPTYAWVRIDVQPSGSNAAFKPFPDDFNLTSGDYLTFEQFVSNIRHSSGAGCGNAYVGEIFDYCLPWLGEGNAECTVVYITDEEAVLTVSSSDILPYYWTYNTASSLNNPADYKWKSSILQVTTMPERAIQDTIVQYVGATTSDYTQGYFYKCNVIPGTPKTYEWVQIDVQPAGGTAVTAYFTGNTGTTLNTGLVLSSTISVYKNGLLLQGGEGNDYIYTVNEGVITFKSALQINDIIAVIRSTIAPIDLSNYATIPQLNTKQNIIQYSTIPTASVSTLGNIIQYIGTTDSTYINGYIYKCVAKGTDPETYEWQRIDIQPAAEPTVIENGPTTIDAAANTIYKFGEISNLTVNSVESSDKEILIYFTAGNNMTISFPNTLNWINNDNIADNLLSGKKYIISIVNNIAIYATY